MHSKDISIFTRLNEIQTIFRKAAKISIIQEILFSTVGCLIFAYVISLFPYHFYEYPYFNSIIPIVILLFAILFGSIFYIKRRYRHIDLYKMILVLFSILNFSILFFLLRNTDFSLYGLNPLVDNWFRTALITKISCFGKLMDFNFLGLPDFYSPLYWQTLGIISFIFKIQSYKMLKYGLLISSIYAPILLYEIWRKIYSKNISILITLFVFTFILNYNAIYSPDHFLTYIFLIPYIQIYFNKKLKEGYKIKDIILGGFFGTLLFLTYFLVFIIIPLFLILQFFIEKRRFFTLKKVKDLFLIFSIILIFTSFFTIPIFLSILKVGWESHQNFYITSSTFSLPVFNFSFTLTNIFLLIGVFVIFINYIINREKSILKLIFVVFFIYFIGYILLLFNFPIMNIRFNEIFEYLILIGLISGFPKFKEYFINVFVKNDKITSILKKKVDIMGILILIILIQNFQNAQNLEYSSAYTSAVNQTIPYEENMIFQNIDYENKVFLTDNIDSIAYLPIFLFISYKVHYANPASLNYQRCEFLYNLSQFNDPQKFYNYLIKNTTFGHIDYFYLNSYNSTHYVFQYQSEYKFFGISLNNLYFNKSVFENGTYFKKIDIHGQVLFQTIFHPITKKIVPISDIIINNESDLEKKLGDNNSNGDSWGTAYKISDKVFNGVNNLDSPLIEIANSSKYVIIQNCTFLNNGFSDSIIGGIKLYNDSNVKIINCTFINNTNGIFVQNSKFINITSNNFNQNIIDGIYSVNSMNNSISNCIFKNNKYSGIELCTDYFDRVENNYIISSNTNYYSSFGFNINNVYNSTFQNNSFPYSKYYGVGMDNNSKYLEFQNNTIKYANIGIMTFNLKNSNFTGNIISNNRKFGIDLISSNNINVNKDNFESNEIAGLFINGTSHCKITMNEFKFNDQYGIYFKVSNSNFIERNYYLGNKVMDYFIDYQSNNNILY